MAQAGCTFCSSPLSTIPRHSHSSKNGAKMTVETIVTHNGLSCIMFSNISFRCSGIGGSASDSGSTSMLPARVTTAAITAMPHPFSLPKWLLSMAYPVSKNWFRLLWYDAYHIAGRNITG